MDWQSSKKNGEMSSFEKLCIRKESSISSAMKQMDAIKMKLLIVIDDEGLFLSLISIGDIQRAIINNFELSTPIFQILRNKVNVAHVDDDVDEIKSHIKNKRNDFMPVIDDFNNIVNVIYWEDIFSIKKSKNQFDIPIVIMAGGKGTRLKPLTNVLPKPLIPIGDKTIVEEIMDSFVNHGSHRFFMSVNYKAELINYYFDNLNNSNYKIEYFKESIPLGTAGSLSLLKGKINTTFFVSNCDIIIDEDYSEILDFHTKNKNLITIVAAIKYFRIPYGTLITGNNGQLLSLDEKPELSYKINTGVYILEPEVIKLIPNNEFFHITQLIDKLIEKGENVGVFPISEGSWKDIGDWSEYLNHISK
jgi:dTDP-glucose pyrophosphorylase